MKGKKSDPEFLSQFIQQCILQNITTPEEIAQLAQQKIAQINEKILEIELLKIERSKLLDVVSTFQEPSKSSKTEEARLISFFQIQHPDICNFICHRIKKTNCTKQDLFNQNFDISDINFCIKQLLEHKIILKVGYAFLPGEMFDSYLKSVLKLTD
jgi:hypothetical protein